MHEVDTSTDAPDELPRVSAISSLRRDGGTSLALLGEQMVVGVAVRAGV